MSKFKLNRDFSYCGGASRDSICTKRDECKRYIKHYDVDEQCLWFVHADDCVDNDHLHFVKLEVKYANNSFNKDLIK